MLYMCLCKQSIKALNFKLLWDTFKAKQNHKGKKEFNKTRKYTYIILSWGEKKIQETREQLLGQ